MLGLLQWSLYRQDNGCVLRAAGSVILFVCTICEKGDFFGFFFFIYEKVYNRYVPTVHSSTIEREITGEKVVLPI
jgi:hypothetical protein